MDKITMDRVALLHPVIREDVKKAVLEADEKLGQDAEIRIVQGLRTFEEQNKLYRQGRTEPGNIVTKAKGGQSYHNYGLAVDFCVLKKGNLISWSTTEDFDRDGKIDWNEVIAVFESYGFKSGRSFKDLPHFEKTFGLNWRQMLIRYNNREFIPGTNYIII